MARHHGVIFASVDAAVEPREHSLGPKVMPPPYCRTLDRLVRHEGVLKFAQRRGVFDAERIPSSIIYSV